MRTIRMIFGFAAMVAFGVGGSVQGADLVTKDGKVYRDYRVVQVDPNGVFIRHAGGLAKLHFEVLSAEVQEKLGYDSGAAERFERDHEEGEPPALPAPPPGGFKKADEGNGNRGVVGPSIAAIQFNVLPGRTQCGPVYNSHLEWRRESLCNLLRATYARPVNYVAPWQWGGYAYNVFRR